MRFAQGNLKIMSTRSAKNTSNTFRTMAYKRKTSERDSASTMSANKNTHTCCKFSIWEFFFPPRSLPFSFVAVLMSWAFCRCHRVKFIAVLVYTLALLSSSRFRRRLDLVAVGLSSSQFRVVLLSAASAARPCWFIIVSASPPSRSRRRFHRVAVPIFLLF